MVIYRAYCPKGLSYIGCTNSFLNRIACHKYRALNKKNNNKFYLAIRKIGFENFKFETLEICDNKLLAFNREIFWINHFDSFKNGYNSSIGGSGPSGMVNKKNELKRKSLHMKNMYKTNMKSILIGRYKSLTVEKQKARSLKSHIKRWDKMPIYFAINKKTGDAYGPFRGYQISSKILGISKDSIANCLFGLCMNKKFIIKYLEGDQ